MFDDYFQYIFRTSHLDSDTFGQQKQCTLTQVLMPQAVRIIHLGSEAK